MTDKYLWNCVSFWVFDRFLRLVRIVLLNYRVFISGKNDPLKRSQATATYDPASDIVRLTVRSSVNFLVGASIPGGCVLGAGAGRGGPLAVHGQLHGGGGRGQGRGGAVVFDSVDGRPCRDG